MHQSLAVLVLGEYFFIGVVYSMAQYGVEATAATTNTNTEIAILFLTILNYTIEYVFESKLLSISYLLLCFD